MTKETSGNSLISQLFDSTVGQERMQSLTQDQQLTADNCSVW